jgi:hypothetical protein
MGASAHGLWGCNHGAVSPSVVADEGDGRQLPARRGRVLGGVGTRGLVGGEPCGALFGADAAGVVGGKLSRCGMQAAEGGTTQDP